MEKRVFLIVLDSFGIGAEPDAAAFGDEGTNTLGAIANHPNFNCPNLKKLGLFNIDGVTVGEKEAAPIGSFARLQEQSMGKDTTIGHWEIAGVVSPRPLPTFPDGFPDSLIHEFEEKTGHKVLCNKPYSGTQVLKDYGEQAMKEDALIVYTSADSVFQVAAHEELVPVHELYRYCEIAREMLKGEYGVGRVIACSHCRWCRAYQRCCNAQRSPKWCDPSRRGNALADRSAHSYSVPQIPTSPDWCWRTWNHTKS